MLLDLATCDTAAKLSDKRHTSGTLLSYNPLRKQCLRYDSLIVDQWVMATDRIGVAPNPTATSFSGSSVSAAARSVG